MDVWKLKDGTVKTLFQKEIISHHVKTNRSADEIWVEARDSLLKPTEMTRDSVRGPPRHSETWWWSSEIQLLADEKAQVQGVDPGEEKRTDATDVDLDVKKDECG